MLIIVINKDMCAIYGSFNKSMFEILHECNYSRGPWAGSYLGAILNNKHIYNIEKWQGVGKIDKILTNVDYGVYLGHLQAPTGINRTWDEQSTHRFTVGDWVVAHNGVITNHKSIIEEYNSSNTVTVDSKLIPLMAQKIAARDHSITEVKSLELALSKLEGTFAIWAFNKKSGVIYISRQGSTLYTDKSGNFSSTDSRGSWDELPEGKIFKLSNKGPILVGQFKQNSPYLLI